MRQWLAGDRNGQNVLRTRQPQAVPTARSGLSHLKPLNAGLGESG